MRFSKRNILKKLRGKTPPSLLIDSCRRAAANLPDLNAPKKSSKLSSTVSWFISTSRDRLLSVLATKDSAVAVAAIDSSVLRILGLSPARRIRFMRSPKVSLRPLRDSDKNSREDVGDVGELSGLVAEVELPE
jgi:hypothetical protein